MSKEHFSRFLDDIHIYRRFCEQYGSDPESETLKGFRWAAASYPAAGTAQHFETSIKVEKVKE